jgi:hypothetical protein
MLLEKFRTQVLQFDLDILFSIFIPEVSEWLIARALEM